ncbi:MAG TPA: DUF302 domain-containing protein [Bryobacteraceae bacterium]|nr:DUF302 domain-containing protein [Bryobacteraceae bacterium]
MTEPHASSLSDYLAAERTFLAWIRTGLALMGFGFVVARFGLFLEALRAGQPNLELHSYGLSLWFGTALIVLGVFVNLACTWTHIRLVRELKRGGKGLTRPSSLAIAVALFLAAIGIAMAIYVITVRQPSSGKENSMNSENGIVTIPGHQSVDQTVQKLQTILQSKGVKLFAIIDHSGEAANAGLTMPNTKLLIFGNPKAGTPLMLASPSIALDLPLKILVAEDASGKASISFNSPSYLQHRHALPANLTGAIAAVEALANAAAAVPSESRR